MKKRNLVLAGGDVVTSDEVLRATSIVIERGLIGEVSANNAVTSRDIEAIDCTGKFIMPGFIDVHTHGGGGADFRDDGTEVFDGLSGYYFSHGVTSVLATLPPLSHDLLLPAVKRLAEYCRLNEDDTNLIGIHLEGPFINEKMSGGNRKEFIQRPDLGKWHEVLEAGGGFIKLMTVAPELDGSEQIIGDAVKNGVAIALGHSTADREISMAAIDRGASQVTHIFNGMSAIHHRTPGLLVHALLSDNIYAQIIADGIHVHPDVIRLVIKTKGADRVLLITDSMRAAGLPDGEYDSAGNKVNVVGGVSRLSDGTLAGSTLPFERGVRLISTDVGADLPMVSRMASLNAARSIGLDSEMGSILPGKTADIVILDADFKVFVTIKNGEVKYRKGPAE